MKNIGSLFEDGLKKTFDKVVEKKGPRNERDELFDYFYTKLAPQWKGKSKLSKKLLAIKISHLSVQDLYYMKSTCNDAERRGTPFSKVFWGSLKPRVDNRSGGR